MKEEINLDVLKIYLQETWRRENHAKYQRYFEEWFNNITENQIYYFNQQRINIENGSMTNWQTKKTNI